MTLTIRLTAEQVTQQLVSESWHHDGNTRLKRLCPGFINDTGSFLTRIILSKGNHDIRSRYDMATTGQRTIDVCQTASMQLLILAGLCIGGSC